MTWYFTNAGDGSFVWDSSLSNWNSSPDGTGETPSEIPWSSDATRGDNLDYATGVSGAIDFGGNGSIGGSGTCNLALSFSWANGLSGGTFLNDVSVAWIESGTFYGSVTCWWDKIYDGTFWGPVTSSGRGIINGTFHGTVIQGGSNSINGGTFYGSVTNNSFISGGTFLWNVYNYWQVTGGTFYTNYYHDYGSTYGGTFLRITIPYSLTNSGSFWLI